MELRNTLTRSRADARYILAPEFRRDMNDNSTEIIVVGSIIQDRRVTLEYVVELPVSKKTQSGTIDIVQDPNGIDFDHQYVYAGTEMNEIDFSVSISGNDMRLEVVTSGLGENPSIRYRRRTTSI